MAEENEKQDLLQELLLEVERLLLTDHLTEEQKCSVLRKIMEDRKVEISQ